MLSWWGLKGDCRGPRDGEGPKTGAILFHILIVGGPSTAMDSTQHTFLHASATAQRRWWWWRWWWWLYHQGIVRLHGNQTRSHPGHWSGDV